MPANTQTLLAMIEALPADQITQVEDFVEFLLAKRRRTAALDRLFAIAPAIEAAGAPAITEDDIIAEVDAARAARRGLAIGAHRS